MKNLFFTGILLMLGGRALAQDKHVTRIARLTIDAAHLSGYRALLKEQMETALRTEPGVLKYEVYADKADPSKLTILEVYADNDAYLAHREATHFKKYKAATQDMVKTLELTEVVPVFHRKNKRGSR